MNETHKATFAKMDPLQQRAVAYLITIVEAVQEAGPQGLPSGPLYATLMSTGVTFEGYTSMIRILKEKQFIRESNHVLYTGLKPLSL